MIAYTAFGDPVTPDGQGGWRVGWPADLGTRYQYDGGWGYESGAWGPGPDGQGAVGGPLALWGENTTLPPVTLQHVGWRWYQPALGRFVQRDPIGIQGGLNVYEYVANRPIARTDPAGLSAPLPSPLDLTPWEWLSKPLLTNPSDLMNTPVSTLVGYFALCAGAAKVGWEAGEWLVDHTAIEDVIGEAIAAPPPRGPSNPCHIPSGTVCFVAGTLVLTEGGPVPIEDLRQDMMVCSHRASADVPALSGGWRVAVSGVTHVLVDVDLGAETLRCTPDHPYCTANRGWIEAADLDPTDTLVTADGGMVAVRETSWVLSVEGVPVYTLVHPESRSYFVGDAGVLVHSVCSRGWTESDATLELFGMP